MQHLASRYKAQIAVLPIVVLVAIATGLIPLADGIEFMPIAASLVAMSFAFLAGDMADSWLFVRSLVHYMAGIDLASDEMEYAIDWLDSTLGGGDDDTQEVGTLTAP